MNLVESYKELGVRVVEPFSPPPLGDADLARAKQIVGNSYVIVSGMDQINVLQQGTVDQVKRATAAAMEIGKPGGGFILNTSISSSTAPPRESRSLRIHGAGTRGLLKRSKRYYKHRSE